MYSLTGMPHRGLSLLGDVDGLLGGFISPVRRDIDRNAGRNVDRNAGFAPALDIVETADGYEVRVDLPGVKKEDLAVNIKDNVLTIEAQSRSEPAQKDGDAVIKSERRVGRQYRALRLGRAVDESRVSAAYNDGVLKLSLPRSAEIQGRKIDVDVH